MKKLDPETCRAALSLCGIANADADVLNGKRDPDEFPEVIVSTYSHFNVCDDVAHFSLYIPLYQAITRCLIKDACLTAQFSSYARDYAHYVEHGAEVPANISDAAITFARHLERRGFASEIQFGDTRTDSIDCDHWFWWMHFLAEDDTARLAIATQREPRSPYREYDILANMHMPVFFKIDSPPNLRFGYGDDPIALWLYLCADNVVFTSDEPDSESKTQYVHYGNDRDIDDEYETDILSVPLTANPELKGDGVHIFVGDGKLYCPKGFLLTPHNMHNE